MKHSLFKNKSFTRSLILGTLVFIIPAIFATTFITSKIYNNNMRDQDMEQTLKSFEIAEERIDELLHNADVLAFNIQQRADVENYLIADIKDKNQIAKQQLALIEVLDETFTSYDYFNGLIFLKSDGSIFGSTPNWRFTKSTDSEAVRQLHDLHSDKLSTTTKWIGGALINDMHPLAKNTKTAKDSILIYGIRRSYYKYAFSDKRTAIDVFISISQDSLDRCFDFLSDDTTHVVLLDGNGKQIAGCNFSEFMKSPSYLSEINLSTDNGSFIYGNSNDEQQVVYYKLKQTDWVLVSTTQMSIYAENTNTMLTTATIVSSIIILIMCVSYSVWASKFCRPITDTTNILKLVEQGDLDVRIEENAKIVELQTMQIQFNQMLDSINTLLEQKEQNEREKLVLEMRSLQAQITPHFIYNTITSIRWMATMCGAHKVADMLIALVSLLRPVFSEWTLDWTLNEELQYVQNYINLMRLRYGNMINIEINKTPDSSSLLIPRFILQPLLENCCEHTSISDKQLNIRLDIEIRDRLLIINVTDDGDGISPEKLDELSAKLSEAYVLDEDTHRSGRSIGLVNVNRRIKLYYGERYGLSISSTEGEYTRVEVTLGIRRR